MIYDENDFYYLDENNYDNFVLAEDRVPHFSSQVHQLPKLFPENLDVFCPGCADYFQNPAIANSYNAPNLYKNFLGTPFLNPANNKFNNYVNTPSNVFKQSLKTFGRPPLDNVLFTTPVVIRSSSDLFL